MTSAKRIEKQEGFSLPELMISLAIITFVIIAISEITMRTIDAVVMGTSQSIAQGSVEQVMNNIADDLRSAGAQAGNAHIRTGSNGSSIIFTRHGQNLDPFAGVDDTNFDEACYMFVPPVGTDPYLESYEPGYIMGGVGPGGGAGCANMYRLTDSYSDVRSFVIQYCRPFGDDGTFACTTNEIDNSGLNEPVNYNSTAACVWMVKISTVYSRIYKKKGENINPDYYEKAVHSYQTAVQPRNIFSRSLFLDSNKDGVVDCCQAEFAYDVSWCPPSQSN